MQHNYGHEYGIPTTNDGVDGRFDGFPIVGNAAGREKFYGTLEPFV